MREKQANCNLTRSNHQVQDQRDKQFIVTFATGPHSVSRTAVLTRDNITFDPARGQITPRRRACPPGNTRKLQTRTDPDDLPQPCQSGPKSPETPISTKIPGVPGSEAGGAAGARASLPLSMAAAPGPPAALIAGK